MWKGFILRMSIMCINFWSWIVSLNQLLLYLNNTMPSVITILWTDALKKWSVMIKWSGERKLWKICTVNWRWRICPRKMIILVPETIYYIDWLRLFRKPVFQPPVKWNKLRHEADSVGLWAVCSTRYATCGTLHTIQIVQAVGRERLPTLAFQVKTMAIWIILWTCHS